MERLLEDWQHDYRATPWEYPISDNNRPATYDQFITLRDTLIFSNKYYADKAGRSLIIGTKLDGTPTDTIEIWEPNLSKMSFEPGYESHPDDENYVKDETQWAYVISGWGQNNPLSCTIKKDWRYRISHKEQFVQLDSSITRIHTFVMQHHWNEDIPRAVFDFEWSTAWEMVRVPAYGYVECDLSKGDVLELMMLDQSDNHIDSASWKLQTYSNWRCVEYIDLAYNK